MKDAIIIFATFVKILFWCVCGIVGYSFAGSDDSPIYRIVVALFAFLACGIFALSFLRKEIKIGNSFWIFVIFLPLFVFAMYKLETGIHSIEGRINRTTLFMAAFCFPAIVEAIYIAQKGIACFAKWMDIIMVVISVAMLSSSILALAGITSIGGASYQKLSYYAAFAFCTNLCLILWGEKYERFSVFKSRSWYFVSLFLLVIQLMACLISGGRGGFVVLAVCTIYMLLKAGKIGKMASLGLFAIAFLGAVSMFFPQNPVYDKLEKTTQRTFSYLSDDNEGANNRSISERDNLYTEAMEYIQEHHFLGTGLFYANNDFGFYPHNIILEMMMQGGALYLIFWLIVWIVFAKKLLYLLEYDDANVILPLVFYAFLSLMFSGTYLEENNFWFVITYVFCRSELISINYRHSWKL